MRGGLRNFRLRVGRLQVRIEEVHTDQNQADVRWRDRELVAAPWHTIVFVGIYAAVATGAILRRYLHAQSARRGVLADGLAAYHSVIPLYIFGVCFEWFWVLYVWLGIRRRGGNLRDLVGGSWSSVRRILIDACLGFGVWLVYLVIYVIPVGMILERLGMRTRVANPLLPRHFTAADAILFLLLAVSAGFCEEIVFRGYLQKQFMALTGSTVAAVLLQAIVFSSGHIYEGVRGVLSAGFLGVLWGLVAWWRKSLRPGMVCHAWSDVFVALISRVV